MAKFVYALCHQITEKGLLYTVHLTLQLCKSTDKSDNDFLSSIGESYMSCNVQAQKQMHCIEVCTHSMTHGPSCD